MLCWFSYVRLHLIVSFFHLYNLIAFLYLFNYFTQFTLFYLSLYILCLFFFIYYLLLTVYLFIYLFTVYFTMLSIAQPVTEHKNRLIFQLWFILAQSIQYHISLLLFLVPLSAFWNTTFSHSIPSLFQYTIFNHSVI